MISFFSLKFGWKWFIHRLYSNVPKLFYTISYLKLEIGFITQWEIILPARLVDWHYPALYFLVTQQGEFLSVKWKMYPFFQKQKKPPIKHSFSICFIRLRDTCAHFEKLISASEICTCQLWMNTQADRSPTNTFLKWFFHFCLFYLILLD